MSIPCLLAPGFQDSPESVWRKLRSFVWNFTTCSDRSKRYASGVSVDPDDGFSAAGRNNWNKSVMLLLAICFSLTGQDSSGLLRPLLFSRLLHVTSGCTGGEPLIFSNNAVLSVCEPFLAAISTEASEYIASMISFFNGLACIRSWKCWSPCLRSRCSGQHGQVLRFGNCSSSICQIAL